MRISELHDREDYHAILKATLCRAFLEWLGEAVSLSFSAPSSAQRWRESPLLSAYTVEEGLCLAGRHFLADGFRYTQARWRQLPQWVLGSALASSPGLRWLSKPAFGLEPGVSEASQIVILPGNQRIRFFHFGTGRSRVVLKEGFSTDAMDAEIRVRGQGETGPFPSILSYDPELLWFEEAILDGYNLARCPRSFPVEGLAARALQRLAAWAEPGLTTPPAGVYVDEVWAALQELISRAQAKFALSFPPLEPLLERAYDLGDVQVGPSHGDCQPGNILVDRAGREVSFVDWEFQGRRSQHFDRLVFVLRSRWLCAFEARALAFSLGTLSDPLLSPLPTDPEWRRSTLGLFLLEELRWRLESAESAPFSAVPAELPALLSTIQKVVAL